MKRFEKELDISTYFKRMRRNYFAVKVLFTRMERHLIKNHKLRVLFSSSDDPTTDSDTPWSENVHWNN